MSKERVPALKIYYNTKYTLRVLIENLESWEKESDMVQIEDHDDHIELFLSYENEEEK